MGKPTFSVETAVFIPKTLKFSKKYMTRKCGNCGAPAPDSNSRFCDLCGSPLVDEPAAPKGLPICPSCGAVVSDMKAQFCDECGAPLAKPVCPACGNPAPATHSKFCTRCGTSFRPGSPVRTQSPPDPSPQSPRQEPVVVRPRKRPQATPDTSGEEWDPWTDGDPLYDISAPLPVQQLQQKPPTDLERIAGGSARIPKPVPDRELPGDGRRKKYSHLPLVAEELKEDARRRSGPVSEGNAVPESRGKQKKKGGMFKFM